MSEQEQLQTIREILIERDRMHPEDADALIAEAKEMLKEYLEDGDIEGAAGICEEYFGLEQDYLFELQQ